MSICFQLQRHGNGTLRFPNGNVYVGDFRRNTITGHGVMTYWNGNCYEGEWKHGLVRLRMGTIALVKCVLRACILLDVLLLINSCLYDTVISSPKLGKSLPEVQTCSRGIVVCRPVRVLDKGCLGVEKP